MKNYYFFSVKSNKYNIKETLFAVVEIKNLSLKEHIAFIQEEMLNIALFKRADLYLSSYVKGEAYIANIINANISLYRCLERDIKKERINEIIRAIKRYIGFM